MKIGNNKVDVKFMNKKYRFRWTERQAAIAKRKVNIDLNDARFASNLERGYILSESTRIVLEGFSKTQFRVSGLTQA